MQKFSVIILGVFFILFSHIKTAPGFEGEFQNITRDESIIKALNVLKTPRTCWVIDAIRGENASHYPMRIMFRKLEKMNPAYASYEALTCVDSIGKIYIFINSKHKDAPAEAIATLLTHEVLHQDEENSIAEETEAWTNEALYWTAFVKRDPSLVNRPGKLVKRLNTLASIYKKNGERGIQRKVMSIPAYDKLDMASAGYEY